MSEQQSPLLKQAELHLQYPQDDMYTLQLLHPSQEVTQKAANTCSSQQLLDAWAYSTYLCNQLQQHVCTDYYQALL